MEDNKESMWATAKVGEKGQIVIPKEIRDLFDIRPGDTLLLMADKKQGIAIPTKALMEDYMKKIFGGN